MIVVPYNETLVAELDEAASAVDGHRA